MRCWSSGLARAGCSLAALPPVSGVYSALAGHGPLAILIRAIVCAVCLLPPTVLMGATLPAASRFVESTPRGVAWTGFLYGGNTVGAVFGSVFAGFYLLRVYDDVFPNGTIWANNFNGGGYDLVLLGQTEPTRIDITALARRFGDERYAAVAQSLGEVGFDSPIALFSTFAGDGAHLGPRLRGAVINRDRNLRLQYLAAVGLNSYQSEAIYSALAGYRAFPDSLFVADAPWLARLKSALR
jgi:hypothetical protein